MDAHVQPSNGPPDRIVLPYQHAKGKGAISPMNSPVRLRGPVLIIGLITIAGCSSPTTSAPANATTAATTATTNIAPVVSGDKGSDTTGVSSHEVTSKPNGSETGPVKGGLWDKLPADKQAAFSKLASKNWAEMDAVTYQNEVYATFHDDVRNKKGSIFLEYAIYLYDNNVGPALEEAKALNPRLVSEITEAENITAHSNGQTKILHQALVEATAYSIGAKDKDAGAALLGLAYDSAGTNMFTNKLAEYNAFDFKTTHEFTVDTVMEDPKVTYKVDPLGGQGDGEEDYPNIIPGAADGHEMRRYTAYFVFNPLSGQKEYVLSLLGSQTQ